MTTIVLIKAGRRSVRQHYAPPLGVLSLAAHLRDRRPDLQLKIIDMLAENLEPDAATKRALDFEPTLIGLSSMSYEAQALKDLAAALKKQKPRTPIIAGGPHPTTNPADTLACPQIDYVARGEGELTLLEFVERVIENGQDPAGLEGIGFRRDGELALNPLRAEMVDIDSLPPPAFDLIDLPRYWELDRFGTTYARKEYAPLSTSRACPYRCTYCHRIFGDRYRAQRPETVLRDLATLARDFGVREVQFVDDCFNLERKRVAAICQGIQDRGLDFKLSFPNGLRGDLIDNPTLDRLKAAGTYRITYAIETASPRLQDFLKKHVKLDKLKKVIEETDARDIMVDGFFMVGFPGETRAEVKATFDYALSSRLHTANFWFVTPFRGTELHEQAKKMGYDVIEESETLHYFDPSTDLSEVPAPELKKLTQMTFLRFYLSPWRLWRIWKLFPNKKQLPSLFLRFIRIALKWS